ncbi:MAG: type II toxin-antitoxin system Phd/YefM family antitoxin [Burkholderiaceae bacterium]
MKTLGVREARQSYQALKETLEKEGEVILTHHGKPFARVLPWTGESKQARLIRRSRELAKFRRTLPKQKTPSEVLIREDRNARG